MLKNDNDKATRSPSVSFPQQKTTDKGKGDKKETPSKPTSSIPSISLPKGGGAIKGIGEKFQMNPVIGTGSLSVPIFTTPGRSDFYPKLSLSYDSGAGNGPFGLGWNLSIPSITRKTDKGLPKYLDAEESDTYILSGAEDLVPPLKDENGNWIPEIPNDDYNIRRYRPRTEGLFARIERWENKKTGEVHWKSISKDNVTSIYGKSDNSRIADPEEESHIFQWLLEESYDDKGNVIRYEYKKENDEKIDRASPQEKNRIEGEYANRYVKHIYYGNKTPRQETHPKDDFMFEVLFDYGEHDSNHPKPDEAIQPWSCRSDAFSNYRAGFEIRTQRLCQRVLMFHHFPNELEIDSYLVRSMNFEYNQSRIVTYLSNVRQIGYQWNADANKYTTKSLPPLEFGYSKVEFNEDIKTIDSKSLENLPIGLDGKQYQWVDLDGEGISGILTEQGDGWFYKRNLGNVEFAPKQETDVPPLPPTYPDPTIVQFSATELVATKPSLANLRSGQTQIMDLAGDGQKDLVILEGTVSGFFERTDDKRWESFIPFSSLPRVNWKDPNLKFIDLNGDGHADILITEHEVFTWYPSKAEEGFDSAEYVRKAFDEEQGPPPLFLPMPRNLSTWLICPAMA